MNTAIGLGSGPRSPERGGLSSITNELWSGSVAVRKQSDPGCTNCIMGKYVSSVKAEAVHVFTIKNQSMPFNCIMPSYCSS